MLLRLLFSLTTHHYTDKNPQSTKVIHLLRAFLSKKRAEREPYSNRKKSQENCKSMQKRKTRKEKKWSKQNFRTTEILPLFSHSTGHCSRSNGTLKLFPLKMEHIKCFLVANRITLCLKTKKVGLRYIKLNKDW